MLFRSGDIRVCNVARASGSYYASDWGPASNYIDEDAAKAAAKNAVDSQTPQSIVDI